MTIMTSEEYHVGLSRCWHKFEIVLVVDNSSDDGGRLHLLGSNTGVGVKNQKRVIVLEVFFWL